MPPAERPNVDRALAHAETAANNVTVGAEREKVLAIVYALEAVTRQIRDYDDTIATVLVPALEQWRDDTHQMLDTRLEAIETALLQQQPRKKGIFD